jgi:hypothetical protein
MGGGAAAASVAAWRPGNSMARREIAAGAVPEWLASLEEGEAAYARSVIQAWALPRRFPGLAGSGPALMGVVNVTTDSFYPGSRRPTAGAAIAEAQRAAAEGASILDVGGQSTRPHSGPVSWERELDAVLPVIAAAREL